MSARPEPRRPKGFRDSNANEVLARKRMLETICGVYARFGFVQIDTPAIEYLDALGKHLPEADTPDAGVFAIRDDDQQWLALRYDLTAPLARFFSEYNDLPRPFRRFQFGPVWRREQKPGPFRLREFMQCDFDTVGSGSVAADAEVCAVLASAMRELGIRDDQFVIRVNNRKILNGLMEKLAVPEETRLPVLRSVDKLDKVGVEGVRQLLGPGRVDPVSSEFSKGANLQDNQIDAIISLLGTSLGSRSETCDALEALLAGSSDGSEGVAELREIDTYLDAMQLPSALVTFDASVVRGLEYYTGPVFEVELTFKVKNAKGRTTNFGSVAGGGRYDYLVERFTGQKIPATGASIGVDRLLSALQLLDPTSQDAAATGPVMVTVMDRDRISDYLRMVTELRANGICAEMYLGKAKASFGVQMKYADKRGAPLCIIAGSNEFADGNVTLKDMLLGTRIAAQVADNTEWRKEQPAQSVVKRDDLVTAVQEILTRQKSYS